MFTEKVCSLNTPSLPSNIKEKVLLFVLWGAFIVLFVILPWEFYLIKKILYYLLYKEIVLIIWKFGKVIISSDIKIYFYECHLCFISKNYKYMNNCLKINIYLITIYIFSHMKRVNNPYIISLTIWYIEQAYTTFKTNIKESHKFHVSIIHSK